ncbi:MAG: response regulator transcription factor [Candidatus Nanopelagicales bacterium]|nr:response regulator transcription factor [Candidatus Nanopelagicales bacterium]
MRLLVLTSDVGPAATVLPALELLTHTLRVLPADGTALLDSPPHEVIIVDGRTSLPHARGLTRLLRATGASAPVLLVVTEGGLAAVQADWGMDDVLLDSCGPAEVEARLRLALGRSRAERGEAAADSRDRIRRGELVINESSYTASLEGRSLDLTFKEFELLKHLALHAGRVFTRAQLLQDVWGYDYYGGTRTVDVHVRRLRAKLGLEYEALIGTVRNVGYRFVEMATNDDADADASAEVDSTAQAGEPQDRNRLAQS